MLTFNPDTGFSSTPVSEIRSDIEARFKSAFARNGRPELNTAPETPAGQLIDSLTAIIAEKDAEVLYLANMFNPLTAEGIWQAALGKIYFLTPKAKQYSVVTCECRGLSGTVIPAGASIKREGSDVTWSTIAPATIPESGTLNVDFYCSEAGPIDASAGTIQKIITVTPGWDSVTNTSIQLGSDAETQKEFEQRRFDSVAINATGSINALYGALVNIDGVRDLRILENIDNSSKEIDGVNVAAHSICIVINGGDDSEIAKAIYMKKNAGCGTVGSTVVTYENPDTVGEYSFYVTRPTSVGIKVKVTIRRVSDLPDNYESIIKNAVRNDFNGLGDNERITLGQTVYASRFYHAVTKTGISNIVSIGVTKDGSTSYSSAFKLSASELPLNTTTRVVVEVVD